MKKILLILILLFLLATSIWALDDPSYYGDGVSYTFNDIKESLPFLYRNTESIIVNTSKGKRTYSLNIEMFLDRGVLVYGSPSSVSDLSYVNDFKQKTGGYFISNNIRGEYRYLGLSINGSVYTNTYFPNDQGPAGQTYSVVKYSSLPQYLKDLYGIKKEGNLYFETIRDHIDSPNGPAWDFTNVDSMGREVTVYEKFFDSGLIQGLNYPSLFEYGRITSWASGGGSLVLYYRSNSDPDNYRYATFNGHISPRWEKKILGIDISVKGVDFQQKMKKDEDILIVNYTVEGIFTDNYSNLTPILKDFTYNREDIKAASLTGAYGMDLDLFCNNYDDKLVYTSFSYFIGYRRENLNVGYNIGRIPATFTIVLGNYSYQASCYYDFLIYVEPLVEEEASPNTEEEEEIIEEKKDFRIIRSW